MNLYEITKKLIGPIQPIGETNADNERYENLLNLLVLTDQLLNSINSVARNKDAQEFSVSRAGKEAAQFLHNIKNQLEP